MPEGTDAVHPQALLIPPHEFDVPMDYVVTEPGVFNLI
jgi:5-formyltetrahydrofolate cyclo-ligase